MELRVDYLAVVANSTLRMMTPILLVTLAAAICSKVRIFNIAMEGTMLTGAFFSIVANYYTHNVFLSVLAFYKHRANIQRLLNGTENKLSVGKNK